MGKLDFLIICEKAFSTEGSKNLNLIGIFDVIYAAGFPATHPMFSVVYKVTSKAGDKHEANLSIKKGALNLFESIVKFNDPSFQFIQNFVNVNFPEQGIYNIELSLDGNLVGSVPLHLKHKSND